MTLEECKGIIVFNATRLGLRTMDDDAPKTLSVPEAGRKYFDLAKNASYQAAREGQLPVIRIGGRLRVPVVALERMLAEAGSR